MKTLISLFSFASIVTTVWAADDQILIKAKHALSDPLVVGKVIEPTDKEASLEKAKCICHSASGAQFAIPSESMQDSHYASTAEKCRSFQGKVYRDLGVTSRTGVQTNSEILSCGLVTQ